MEHDQVGLIEEEQKLEGHEGDSHEDFWTTCQAKGRASAKVKAGSETVLMN